MKFIGSISQDDRGDDVNENSKSHSGTLPEMRQRC